jgi:hypothetical protein
MFRPHLSVFPDIPTNNDLLGHVQKPVNTCVHHFPTPFVPQRSFTLNSIDMEPLLEPTDITFELMPISFMFFSGMPLQADVRAR